ncbi:SMI1/KNR4 family protein [Kitasatospora sp. NPDC090308]|uniref:SMI1/KNR4 family protein n=1 Tax=Kitasatospora sp. NPDC090308 TaxID=3364082 RepID=UPI00381BCACA
MTLDLARDLPAALADRAAAWRLIAEIAAFWGTPLRPGAGTEVGTGAGTGAGAGIGIDAELDAELDAAEARLGLRLPAALREAHRLIGNRPDLTGNHDTLLPPAELYVDRGCLVHRVENQSCAYWGIPLAALGQDDPPTVGWPDVAPSVPLEITPWTARFSTECLSVVLTEPLLDEDAYVDAGEVDPADLADLADWTELPRLHEPGVDTRFFARPEGLLVVRDGSWLAMRAVSGEALDALCEELPVSWLDH